MTMDDARRERLLVGKRAADALRKRPDTAHLADSLLGNIKRQFRDPGDPDFRAEGIRIAREIEPRLCHAIEQGE